MTETRPAGPPTHRRSDARRNHERVVAAARELFTERGLDVTVPEVAARAGVGRATVYRSYPSKDDLVAAVAGEEFEALLTQTRAALAQPDAASAFREYVPELFDRLARNRGLAGALFEARLAQAEVLLELIERLLSRAAEAGPFRPDAGLRDVRVLLCGAIRQLIVLGERDPDAWRHYGELVVSAFRR